MQRTELDLIAEHGLMFTDKFVAWLPENWHVWDAFVDETFKIIACNTRHYSARTILHYLRHHTTVTERNDSGWKLNNDYSPYLARLFDLKYPQLAGLFEYRETPAVFYK